MTRSFELMNRGMDRIHITAGEKTLIRRIRMNGRLDSRGLG